MSVDRSRHGGYQLSHGPADDDTPSVLSWSRGVGGGKGDGQSVVPAYLCGRVGADCDPGWLEKRWHETENHQQQVPTLAVSTSHSSRSLNPTFNLARNGHSKVVSAAEVMSKVGKGRTRVKRRLSSFLLCFLFFLLCIKKLVFNTLIYQ